MAVEIHTPFPSIESVAKSLGVPLKRAREIERLVSANGEAARSHPTARLGKTKRSRRRSGRR